VHDRRNGAAARRFFEHLSHKLQYKPRQDPGEPVTQRETAHPTGSFGRGRQRLIEIGDQVVRGLQSDREADHIRSRARGHPLLVG
jgi:hypothetical protein